MSNGLNYRTRPETLRKAVAARTPCGICGQPTRPSSLRAHENRHRVEQQTKPCVGCGAPMSRNSRDGQVQWDRKRFCSYRCKGRWEANHRSTPISESYIVRDNGCWEWNRSVGPDGYGKVRSRDRRGTTGAHRLVWTELIGPIPEGMTLDHLCRNTRCVNPAHLEPVTLGENVRRANAARTRCKQGHPLDGRRAEGRYCLTCHRNREADRREARRVLTA